MSAPRTAVNRSVLATVGVALLVGGTWLACARTTLLARLPDGWPSPPPGTVLLDRGGLAGLRAHTWWTPSVIAAGVLATVLLAWWLLGQIHVGRRPLLPLATAGGSLRTRALEAALTERALTVDGIGRCRVHLHTRRRTLQLHLRVWLEPDVTPGTVIGPLRALTAEAASAAAPYEIDTRLHVSHLTHRIRHVR
ncbi:hypothetical protein [Streptomyces sp. NPDC049949]|uniref:hypothetical protein n=1 Tax=Streptomyces sp. NPDC049949 TaxID=3154627 RepID=UPI003424F33C